MHEEFFSAARNQTNLSDDIVDQPISVVIVPFSNQNTTNTVVITGLSVAIITLISGSQMFYSVQNVNFNDLCTLVRHRASLRSDNATPTLYFDVSWLARKLSTPSNDVISSLVHLASKFIGDGIKVVLCFDNTAHCHHSKKATIVRNVKAEQARVDCVLLHTDMMTMFNEMKDESTSDEEKKILQDKMIEIEKKILRLKKIVHERLRFSDLYDKLIEAASQLMHKHPNLLTYVEAKTQADTVICYESVNGCCDGAISNDGDFIMVGGEKMLLIKDFKINRRGNKLGTAGNFHISSSHFNDLKSVWVDILKKK